MFDADDIAKIRAELESAESEVKKRLHALSKARQIAQEKFVEVRLKAIKAKYYKLERETKKSQADADEFARTNPEYLKEIEQEKRDYERARELIDEWAYWSARVETRRSLLSMAKQAMGFR
jgi:chromosome segregation ATPase